MTEGLHLLKLNLSPYAGDVFHQPPLVLLAFYPLQSNPLFNQLFFVTIDLLSAFIIREITALWQSQVYPEIQRDDKVKNTHSIQSNISIVSC